MALSPEEKRANFVRLATARTNACLDRIRTIGNLASGQYDKTPEDVDKMFGAIRAALDAQEAKFSATKQAMPKFEL
jgi:hypothetical protein